MVKVDLKKADELGFPPRGYALGFASQWINWVMAAIVSSRYGIRINGKIETGKSGLRQGCPTHLYLLFALRLRYCVEC